MSITDDLIKKYSNSRTSIEEYIKEIEEMKSKINKLFPDKIENRNRWAFEQKIKSSTEFLNVLLRMKQEFHRTIEKEIEIRRKNDNDKNQNGNEVDIRALVEEMEKAGFKITKK